MSLFQHCRSVALRAYDIAEADEVRRVTIDHCLSLPEIMRGKAVVVLCLHQGPPRDMDEKWLENEAMTELLKFMVDANDNGRGITFKGYHAEKTVEDMPLLLGAACRVAVAHSQTVFRLPNYYYWGNAAEDYLNALRVHTKELPSVLRRRDLSAPELKAEEARDYGIISHVADTFVQAMQYMDYRA